MQTVGFRAFTLGGPRSEKPASPRGAPFTLGVMSDVFLARQPILDRKQSVEAYELLYRHENVDRALVDDNELATARVALGALTEIGLDRVVGRQRVASSSLVAGRDVRQTSAHRWGLLTALPATTHRRSTKTTKRGS